MSRTWIALAGMLLFVALPARARAEGGDDGAQAPARPPAARELTLAEFLEVVSGRSIDLRRAELRVAESRAKLDYLRRSRAFELDIDGQYGEQDLDRLERNGDRVKTGRLHQYERELNVAVTRPLLGLPLEDRLLGALEEQKIVEYELEARIERRQALLSAADLFLELNATQDAQHWLREAAGLEAERIRILELRRARSESLERDVLAARADLAGRRLALVRAERREAELLAGLGEGLDGPVPAPFRARSPACERLGEAEQDLGEPAGEPAPSPPPPPVAGPPRPGGSLWYNVPEIDLTVGYTYHSLDRTFADERRRERGNVPEVELSVELPLDFYRAGRAFRRQVEARRQRQQLDLLMLERRMIAQRSTLALAVREAEAGLAVADAELSLAREKVRVAELRAAAADTTSGIPVRPGASGLEVIGARLDALDAQIELIAARRALASSLFEDEVTRGTDPLELARSWSPPPPAPDPTR